MGFLLVRHADAVDGGGELDDAARWLSLKGRARALASAHMLRDQGLSFQRFLSSPRVRAIQTAELYARVLGFSGAVESLPALSFSAPAERAADALRACSGNVAAFGHMPTIAEIVQRLTGGARPVPLLTSEAVWIEGGRMVFRLPPADVT